MAKARKSLCEIITPGPAGWERWQAVDGQPGESVETFGTDAADLHFSSATPKRLLVLPVAHAWVMPAWLKGAADLLQDMALLHLERLGVRVEHPERALQLIEVAAKDDARLITMLALKDEPTPLAVKSPLPDLVAVSAALLPLAPSGITVWRELGRLVIGITSGAKLVYASPLSATRFDERALGELNNVCLQLGFQRVLGRVEQLVLWLPPEEGVDSALIEQVTGLPVRREEPPAWCAPAKWGAATLLPEALHQARHIQESSRRHRLLGLSAGALAAAVVAVLSALITLEIREQHMLREKVAELSPRAARVLDQKRAWQEAAPAVDPSQGPLQFLLGLQEPATSHDVTLLHVEFTPKQVMLRGHTPDASLALNYSENIQQTELLFAYQWEAPPPEMAEDESATFELKGVRP